MIQTLLLIFVLQVVYVTLLTIRTILTIKGYRYYAAALSAIDVLVYVTAFKIILDNLDKPINLIIYCIGYAIGILVGVYVEERLALGYVNLSIVSKDAHSTLAEALREKGFGVTTWNGEGLEGQRKVLYVTTQKKNQRKLYQLIKQIDQDAFVVSYDSYHFQGGFSLNPFRKKFSKKEAHFPL